MLVFDTFDYARKLQKVGFSEEQAVVQVEALCTLLEHDLATKPDIANLQRDIAELRKETQQSIESLRNEICILSQVHWSAGLAMQLARSAFCMQVESQSDPNWSPSSQSSSRQNLAVETEYGRWFSQHFPDGIHKSLRGAVPSVTCLPL